MAWIGYRAKRRLLQAQRTSCDTISGATAYTKVCQPVTVDGQRVAALRFDHPVTQALTRRPRLRLHGLIERTPHTFRYKIMPFGLRSALILTRIHNRFLTTVMAHAAAHQPNRSPLGRALDNVATEINRVAPERTNSCIKRPTSRTKNRLSNSLTHDQ